MSAYGPDAGDQLEPIDAADDFLSGIGPGGMGRVDESSEAEKPDWIRARWAELRDGRYPRIGRVFASVSRRIPASFFSWAFNGLDDGSIWDSEVTRGGGPSDTCAIGLPARREADWQIGFRLMMAATPIWLLVGAMFALFVVLQSNHMAAHHDEAKIGPAPPTHNSSEIVRPDSSAFASGPVLLNAKTW